eukprot:56412_1
METIKKVPSRHTLPTSPSFDPSDEVKSTSDESKPLNTDLKLAVNPEEIKEQQSEPHTPNVADQWSYDETDNIETLLASDGDTWTFRKENKKPRIIYFSMKIKRFSDIDNVRECFRCRFHLYLNWIVTKKEYEQYLEFKKESQKKKRMNKWEPKFHPRIEFVNNVEEHLFDVVEYPPDGCYRIHPYNSWLAEKDCGFDANRTLFVRQKMECDYTFSEQLELRTFPFDCQDFTVKVRESSGTKKATLLPEPRYTSPARINKSNFFKLDPTFSVLDEWDFHSTCVEVADSSSGASRSKSVYKEITIRFKMSRRWKVYFLNIIIYFMVITFLSLTCFALDTNDIGERLNLAVTILLTLVAFQHTVFSKLPNIPYLTFLHKYIILSFIFVCVVILESSFVPIASTDNTTGDNPDLVEQHTNVSFDVSMGSLFTLFWICYHLFFLFRSGWHRHVQARKLVMDSDQINELIEAKYPQFLMSWKSFYDVMKHGGVDEWAKKEKDEQIERRDSLRSPRDLKKNGKGPPKALCVMEFGGKRGEILTFASYAQKDSIKEMTFCGYIGGAFTDCFISCVSCCFCECCRRDTRERNKSISQKKSEA